MNNLMSFPYKRIDEIGLYLAEFALEFIPGKADLNNCDDNYFEMLFDICYRKFISYAETNRLITREELMIMDENPNELYGCIKVAAINAARKIINEKHNHPFHNKTSAWRSRQTRRSSKVGM